MAKTKGAMQKSMHKEQKVGQRREIRQKKHNLKATGHCTKDKRQFDFEKIHKCAKKPTCNLVLTCER